MEGDYERKELYIATNSALALGEDDSDDEYYIETILVQ
jgi:hypothetical protein